MSESSDAASLAEARDLREQAWALVKHDISGLREGIGERPIGRRIKDAAAEEVVEAIDTAREVASEHKAIVAGTMLALAAWVLRGPIGSVLHGFFGGEERGGHDEEGQDSD
ncbi:hypothetical protein [Novosphingobium lentum]|uniref:hypothetical protein n=1 Tax=Novosphingobium lentum TaxID=145287 RepID=UPI0008362CEF|nr:hypothetical protein [Novosphingobium lentum]